MVLRSSTMSEITMLRVELARRIEVSVKELGPLPLR